MSSQSFIEETEVAHASLLSCLTGRNDLTWLY